MSDERYHELMSEMYFLRAENDGLAVLVCMLLGLKAATALFGICCMLNVWRSFREVL